MNIDSTTQGVSADGLETLYNEIHMQLIDNAKEALDDYGEVQTAIEAMWSGTDEQKFMENFITLKDKVKTALDTYDSDIKTEFQKVYNQWADFQSTNVK